jgi:hypothetical protein
MARCTSAPSVLDYESECAIAREARRGTARAVRPPEEGQPVKKDIERIKKVTVELLATPKHNKQEIDDWHAKEHARDAEGPAKP